MDLASIGLLFLYLSMLAIGYIIGHISKKKEKKIAWTGKALYVAVAALIFVMGIRIGSNKEILPSLDSIGFSALIFTVFTMAGSVVAVVIARKLVGIDRKGVKK